MNAAGYSAKLIEKGLKVTPQRIAVLEAILEMSNHPTVENIIDSIRKEQPNISSSHKKGLLLFRLHVPSYGSVIVRQ